MFNPTQSSPSFGPYDTGISNRIERDISSGKLTKKDGNAIASALGDIASAFKTSTSSSATFDQKNFRTKLKALIEGEVKSGKLTQNQADELQALLFPKPLENRKQIAVGTSGTVSVNDDNDHDDTGSTPNVASSTQSISEALQEFIKLLQSMQNKLEKANYAATGEQSSSSARDPLVLDRTA